MSENRIPKELRNLIDSEETDFIVKSRRNHQKRKHMDFCCFQYFGMHL